MYLHVYMYIVYCTMNIVSILRKREGRSDAWDTPGPVHGEVSGTSASAEVLKT